MREKEWFSYLVILIVSFFLVADLFLHPGRSITFDGHVHITTIAQFYNALKDGEFPARWANGFANYGLPIPLVAHQTTSYLGAFFQFFTHNAVLSYNLVMLGGVFLSSAFFYRFLRYYFPVESSLLATVLFHFAPYRITNIYIRGALPELFGTVFLPVVLIGIYQVIKEKKKWSVLWIVLGTALLALTHPMMLVLSSVVIVPYTLYMLWPLQRHWLPALKIIFSGVLGLMIAGYYLLPLAVEIKYFAYGTTSDHFRPEGGFLQFPNYFVDGWSYLDPNTPGPRENTLTMGSIETGTFIIGLMVLFWQAIQKKRPAGKRDGSVVVWFVIGGVCLLLMTKFSTPIYQHIFLFNNVQYPWRNLSGLMFVPPFILAWLLMKYKKWWLVVVVVAIIGLVRFPQLYGKNFMEYDLSHYDFVTANLHTNNMNTLWMGDSRQYPVRTQQYAVIEGAGTVESSQVKNSDRIYTVRADGQIRMVDYTFYFPGWMVSVDGQPAEIQFQDPAYRGLITYVVPAGNHTVRVRFTQTKIRVLGDVVTLFGLLATGLFVWVIQSKWFQKISTSLAVRK